MNLSLLSIVSFLVGFLLLLAKPDPDKRRWRRIVILGSVLLGVNVTVEVGKRISDVNRQRAAKQSEAEQRALSLQMMEDVKSLNRAATEAFERLGQRINSIPAATAATWTEEARRIQTQLNAVTEAGPRSISDGASITRLKALVEETKANIRDLNASIEMQRTSSEHSERKPVQKDDREGIRESQEPARAEPKMAGAPDQSRVATTSSGTSPVGSPITSTPSTTMLAVATEQVADLGNAPEGREKRRILERGSLAALFDMAVNTDQERTDWLSVEGDQLKIAYPKGQSWGAALITIGKPTAPPRRSVDLSTYTTLAIEMRGATGHETVQIGVKSSNQPDDGSETTVAANPSADWKTFRYLLTRFSGADLKELYVVAEFVFSGPENQTVFVRNVTYER